MPAAEAAVRVTREGDALRLEGPLLRASIPALWRQALPLLPGARRLDLHAVSRVDSAGVACLAELATSGNGLDIDGAPEGLDALRAAYRLSPGLAFAQ